MINKIVLFIFLIPSLVLGQVKESPLKWSFSSSKTDVKIGEEIELIFKATIEDGWYSYSKGPFETAPEASFNFEKNATYELVGDIKPIHDKEKNDEFLGKYRYFVGKAEFRQKVKILAENPEIKVVYEYYSCSSESGRCLPPFEEETVFKGFIVSGKIVSASKSIIAESKDISNEPNKLIEKKKSNGISNLSLPELLKLKNRLNEKYTKINSTSPALPKF